MTKIEERADDKVKSWNNPNDRYLIKEVLIEMAEEQRKIDADRVRECLRGILAENMVNAVIKVMED